MEDRTCTPKGKGLEEASQGRGIHHLLSGAEGEGGEGREITRLPREQEEGGIRAGGERRRISHLPRGVGIAGVEGSLI